MTEQVLKEKEESLELTISAPGGFKSSGAEFWDPYRLALNRQAWSHCTHKLLPHSNFQRWSWPRRTTNSSCSCPNSFPPYSHERSKHYFTCSRKTIYFTGRYACCGLLSFQLCPLPDFKLRRALLKAGRILPH